MKKVLTNIITAGAFLLFAVVPTASLAVMAVPSATYAEDAADKTSTGAAANADKCGAPILGVRPWYYGLTDADCNIKGPADQDGLSTFIWAIVLNVIDAVLTIVAYIAVALIIYGGFLFMTGGGVATQIEKGRKTVMNAVIGLVLAMGSIGLVRFVFNIFGTAASGETANGLPKFTGAELLHSGLNTAYFIGGLIAVLVIIIAGINYATSSGDSGKVSKAKNMIVYAIAGLVVILVAFAITNFVMRSFAQ